VIGAKRDRVKGFEVGASRLASERVLEHGSDRDSSQRGADARAVLAVDLLDDSDRLADGRDVLARDVGQASLTQIGRLAPYRLAGSGKESASFFSYAPGPGTINVILSSDQRG
jgi:hypothetical protein